MTNYRPTWAEINLGAIKYNLNQIKKMVSPRIEIMPVVKANAYGHGISQVSKVFVENGIKSLGVATIDEAIKLREDGIGDNVSILVLGNMLEEEARVAIENNITLTLCDNVLFETIVKIAKILNKKPRVHVMVDTGMGRIGVWHEKAYEFIKEVHKNKYVELEGVYTHFASAARDTTYTKFQIDSFEKVIFKLKEKGIKPKYRHAANSIATVDWDVHNMNLVRPGILLYGIYPKKEFKKVIKLKAVMSLKTKIVFLKDIPSGRSISYGRTFMSQKPTKIATIPIGYADGYGRILSNRAEALLNGELVHVAGIVTMDQTLLDVGDVKNVKVGDEVVLFGSQKEAIISIEKISRLAKTIPYEILAGITNRVPRTYVEK